MLNETREEIAQVVLTVTSENKDVTPLGMAKAVHAWAVEKGHTKADEDILYDFDLKYKVKFNIWGVELYFRVWAGWLEDIQYVVEPEV